MFHLGDCGSLAKNRPGGTGLCALAARSARLRAAPELVHVGNDTSGRTPAADVPGMRALNLVAGANATRAEDAAVVINAELVVGRIDIALRMQIIKAHMVDTMRHCQVLQFAMIVGDANGANMISLGEQQFQNHSPVFLQLRRACADYHSFLNSGRASCLQAVAAADFDQAQSASSDRRQAINVAQRWNRHSRLAGREEQCVLFARTD